MLGATLTPLFAALTLAMAGSHGEWAQPQAFRQSGVQRQNVPTTEWAIGRWYLENSQCRGRSYLILNADGTYVLEEFDAGTWRLSGNGFYREPRRMFLGDGMTRPESYLRVVPTTDRIDYVDAGRMVYTVSATGFRGVLVRCS